MKDYTAQETVEKVRKLFPEGIIEVGIQYYCPARKGTKIRFTQYRITVSNPPWGNGSSTFLSCRSYRDCVSEVSKGVLIEAATKKAKLKEKT